MDDPRETAEPFVPISRARHDERHTAPGAFRMLEQRVVHRSNAAGVFVVRVGQVERGNGHVSPSGGRRVKRREAA
jgi:hypothetical protein